MCLPRVALFADSFHEVNGVAHTCRQFEAFAKRRRLGFLCVRCGPEAYVRTQGPLWLAAPERGQQFTWDYVFEQQASRAPNP